MSRARTSSFLTLALAAGLAALLPCRTASADTVWLRAGQATNALERPNVRVEKVENGVLSFRSLQSDRVTERPLEEVVRIAADGEPVFTQAEEAFAAGKWEPAAAAYQKAIGATNKQWVKDRSSLRLVTAAEKSGKFPAAVAGWVTLMARDPAVAARYKPQIPAGAKAGSLDPAVAEVERALKDAKLAEGTRQALLSYQLELARANGDTRRAQSIGNTLSRDGAGAGSGGGGGARGAAGTPAPQGTTSAAPAPGASGGAAAAPGPNAGVALQLAHLALDQKQFDQAIKHIDGAAPTIIEPEQQVEALYVLAEARAGLAKDDPAALKDAALAYMRVVARGKSARAAAAAAAAPQVAESLLKTAAIQERLKAPQEALLLYQQVSDEFKGTDAATRAARAAERLGKGGKSATTAPPPAGAPAS